MLILLAVLCTSVLLAIVVVIVSHSIHVREIKIENDKGIQENTYIEIGGIRQYLQIRGENHENPVILWLHGGPGFPLSYLSYYYPEGIGERLYYCMLGTAGMCGTI